MKTFLTKFSKIFVIGALLLTGSVAALNSVAVPAVYADAKQEVCEAISGSKECKTKESGGVTKVFRLIVNIISLVAGFVAVIMIIMAGFKYITAAGDTNKLASAKSSLIGAIIGLIIVALSQLLVFTVLKQTSSITGDSKSGDKTKSTSKTANR